MIKLDRLVLNNVGPYRFEENSDREIQIEKTGEFDFIFLHGSPTHGKTSFRNALSWLLCNRFSDSTAVVGKHSNQNEIADFINQNCIEHPDHDFYVQGELIDNNKAKKYIIKKSITLKNEVEKIDDIRSNPPTVTTDVKVIDIGSGKEDPPVGEPEHFLDNMFPARLLDYFFVSGNDVKERLERDDLAADIESILGLDKFNNFKSVLVKIKEETENKYAKDKKADKDEKKIIEQKNAHNIKLKGPHGNDGLINELEQTQSEIKEKEYIKKTAISELSKYEEGRKIKDELDDIERHIEELEAENKDNAEYLADHSGLFWKVYAYNHVIKIRQEKPVIYKSKDSDLIKAIENIDDKTSYIFQGLDNKTKGVLIDIYEEHQSKLDIEDDHCTSFDQYAKRDEEIKKRVTSIHKTRYKIQDLKLDLQVKTNQLSSTSFKDKSIQKHVEQEQGKLDGIQSSIDTLGARANRLKGEIEVCEEGVKECDDKLDKIISHMSPEEKKLYNIATFLIPIIEQSMTNCKEQYRDMFENKCNEVFNNIKNQKNPNDYLKIDKNYKMIIMRPGKRNKNNETTSKLERIKKSGSEGFIAASAVTLALSQLAIKDFPIVLDAPFEQGDHDDEIRLINGWLDIKQQAIISFQKPKDDIKSPLTYSELKKKFPQSKHYRIEKDPDLEMSWFREIK